jgi:O-antigen/teichoic acid export membrane protein
MTRIKRLAKEGSWIVAGQIAAVAGALVLVRVLTEHLDPAQYGQLALGLTIAGLVNQVAMGGVTGGIGRFYSISLEKGDLWGYLRASNRLMGYATLGASAIALVLMVGLFLTGQMQWLGLAAAVLIFSILSVYNSALGGIQNAARQRAIVALHGGMDAWLKIGLAVGVVLWLGSSSTAVVIGYALSALLVTVSQLFFLRRLLRRHGGNTHNSSTEDWARQMWLFSWPMMAGGLFNWGYYASQRWALELFVSTADVGKFYALTQVAYSPITMAAGLFMSMLVPILYARAGDPGNHQRIANVRGIVFKIASLGLVATFLLAGITFFWHEAIFKLLVAQQYLGMSVYMPLVVISAGLLQSSIAMGSILTSANKTNKVLPLAIYGQSIIIISNMVLAHLYGITGLLFSMIFGAGLHIIWMYSIIVKHGHVKL